MFWIDDDSYYKVSYSKKAPEDAGAYDVSSIGSAVCGYVITEGKTYFR